MTPCEFALGVLGNPEYEPTDKQRYEGDAACAVCGERADRFGSAWKREAAISGGFAEYAAMSDCFSPAVCKACGFFAVGSTLKDAIAARGMTVKSWASMSWRCFSHVFVEPGEWAIPSRDGLRSFLMMPSEPPFLVVLTTKGRKNLMFRSQVAEDRELFPVMFEDETVIVNLGKFTKALSDFETAMKLGIRRKTLMSGTPESGNDIQAAGFAAWRQAEALVAPWRAREQPLFRLVGYVAAGPAKETTSTREKEEC